MLDCRLAAASLLSIAALGAPCIAASERPDRFVADAYLLAPLRVHLLASDETEVATTLTRRDVTGILEGVNWIWDQAGIHFYVESVVREWTGLGPLDNALPELPSESRVPDVFHIYYVKEMPVPINGMYTHGVILIEDRPKLEPVRGGGNGDPIPRVTAHELGHALGLPHREHEALLMTAGTTGYRLDGSEIDRAREAAEAFDWVARLADVRQQAARLEAQGHDEEAQRLLARLSRIAEAVSGR